MSSVYVDRTMFDCCVEKHISQIAIDLNGRRNLMPSHHQPGRIIFGIQRKKPFAAKHGDTSANASFFIIASYVVRKFEAIVPAEHLSCLSDLLCPLSLTVCRSSMIRSATRADGGADLGESNTASRTSHVGCLVEVSWQLPTLMSDSRKSPV